LQPLLQHRALVDKRAQIEAQFKSVNVTDLTLSGAQRALTYKPAGGDGNSGGNGNGSGGGTPAGDYDKLEEKLIAKLKELNANEAKAHADKTIAALNDTVADIISIAKLATAKAAKLGAVQHPSQS
jgi:hypothetical protein